jgi:RNA exonuclease 4
MDSTPTPSPEQFLALSCVNVGVGPGGTTSMVAYVNRLELRNVSDGGILVVWLL